MNATLGTVKPFSMLVATLTMALLISTPAHADDARARHLLATASDIYTRRGESADVPNLVLSTLANAESEAQAAELKYDILVLESRVFYWQGTHAAHEVERAAFHLKGQQKADAAIALLDNYAEAYYYAGLNFWRWTISQGTTTWQTRHKEVMEYMKKASDPVRSTRDSDNGERIDGYGPSRLSGRIYGSLPVILGGDHNLAVTTLERAVAGAPNFSLNLVYLADVLLRGTPAEQARGRALLTTLLSQDPVLYGTTFNRVPETIEEFGMARDLLSGRPIP